MKVLFLQFAFMPTGYSKVGICPRPSLSTGDHNLLQWFVQFWWIINVISDILHFVSVTLFLTGFLVVLIFFAL